MTSKYRAKLPKPVTKQMTEAHATTLYVSRLKFAVCTNCGRQASTVANTYSKCPCGGTYQTYKAGPT